MIRPQASRYPADFLDVSIPPMDPIMVAAPPRPSVTPPTRITSPQSFSATLAAAVAQSTAPAPAPLAPAAAPMLPTAAPAAPAATAAPGSYSNLSGDLDGSPELLSRLNRLAAARGERWTVTSGLRTDAEQAELWANRANNPFPVARPGTSVHRTGAAADVTIGGRPIQEVVPAAALRAAGIEPLIGDAVHVQLPGT
jgi:hypothetical protein